MKYALTITLASMLLSGSAYAQQAMVVKVRDLNLHTRAGAYVAIQRMDDAAALFCTTGLRNGPRELDVTTLKCRRDLAARAAAKLASPEVIYLQSQVSPMKMFAAGGAHGMAGAMMR